MRAGTEAGKRKVPVVDAKVRAMLHKRVTASHGKKSAPVFPELPVDRFGDRSKPLVKRLGRTLRGLGMTDPALVAGHSWRHRARTLMEAAEVAPWTADYLIGHARPGEGLGRYSRPSEEQLIKAVKAVPLPV